MSHPHLSNSWSVLDEPTLHKILNEDQFLTSVGMDSPRREGFSESRAEVYSSDFLNQVNHCIAFLSSFTPVRTPNQSSYALKHQAEEWGSGTASYIPNGALIVAATHLGLAAEYAPPNVVFGLSKPEYDWVWFQNHGGPSRGIREPQGWQTFLSRRHLFA